MLWPHVLRAVDWSGTAAGIAVITILSVIGFLLLLALLVGLAILAWCAFKGCRKGRNNRDRDFHLSTRAAGRDNFAAFPRAQENESQAQENEPRAQGNEPQVNHVESV
jgi:predicted lipid-binding transport protein (Tim44 family)